MANFSGRADNLLLFVDGERAVVVDSNFGVIVASGQADIIRQSAAFPVGGEYSEADATLAEEAFATMDSRISAPTGRLYTVPRGVQQEAKKAVRQMERYHAGGTDVSLHTAALLASGGQIGFEKLRHISKYFARHANDKFTDKWEPSKDGSPSPARITWGMWGGDTAQKWTSSILNREGQKAITADGIFTPTNGDQGGDPFMDAFNLDPDQGPEFLARVRLDGSGIDRLYKIDVNGEVYVWDDDSWDDLGAVQGDIYTYDAELDDPDDDVDKSHIVIDPSSAVIIGARLTQTPFGCISIEDIDADEAQMAADAIGDGDWDYVDAAMTSAAVYSGAAQSSPTSDQTPGVYSPAERSANAETQVRDAKGKFAEEGQRVMVGGNPSATGSITQVNPATGTVNVQLESGGSVTVPGKTVESVGAYTATIPGKPVAIPNVDLSGILAEPRTPINYNGPQIPGTLPAMTSNDLHNLLYNWPAWVTAQRAAFKAAPSMAQVAVQGIDSTDGGQTEADLEKQTGVKLIKDAYDQPLLNKWLNETNADGSKPNSLWYQPEFSITADGSTLPAGTGLKTGGAPVAPSTPIDDSTSDSDAEDASTDDSTSSTEITPDNSDVQPIYMAIVAPDDPTAVTQLISLVPASATSSAPMVYTREDGKWNPDPRTLADLQSATPPPVVPLNSDALQATLAQVDATQNKNGDPSDDAPTDPAAPTGTTEIAGGAPITPASGSSASTPAPAAAPAAPVTASLDQTLMVLWGPHDLLINQALTAAGGLDRDRGNAETLRRYWTHGAGAAKIMWNTPGDWTRCVRNLAKYLGDRSKGYCSLRHKETTGMWPGDKANRDMSSRAEGTFSTDELVTEEEFLSRATLYARAETARLRFAGPEALTAAAALDLELGPDFKTQYGPVYATPGNSSDATGAAFRIPLVLPIGLETGDGRIVDPEAQIDLRNLPLPLLWQIKTGSGHDGSVVVGRIDSMEVTNTGVRNAVGVFDTGVFGAEAQRLVQNGFLYGVSADMDKFSAQEIPVFAEDGPDDEDNDEAPVIESRQIVINKTRIMAVTIVAKPAFQECQIFIDNGVAVPEEDTPMIPDGLYVEDVDPSEAAAIVAAGYVAENIPVAPPRSWFENPDLLRPTPIQVSDEGHVFGHIAAWDTDHVGMANNIKPPRSRSDYAYFKTGVLRTAEGEDVSVGQLTLAGGHAGLEFSAREAVKHYDDTASGIADVTVGEDQFGIWVSGGLRPGTTPEQVRVFRASAPSGDWRPIKGRLELVAVCQVNVPGFPVARTLVAGGQQMALVAAGAATLAHLKSDPITEMTARLEKLEQFTTSELNIKISPIREKFAAARAERDAELAAKAEALAERVSAMTDFAYIPTKKRKEMARKGQAMPDGSFPIANVDDLKKAIKAHGRAKNPGPVKKHIIKRAHALGASKLIPDTWKTASVTSAELADRSTELRNRIAEFATPDTQARQNKADAVRKVIQSVDPNALPQAPAPDAKTPGNTGGTGPKYTPKTQPRNEDGKFRLILARLRDNVGVSGNQDLMNKIKSAQNLDTAGNYKAASTSYADLVNTIDRIGTKSLDGKTTMALKQASRDLSAVVANLPLPFDDQSQKIRFSDLPPVLREMVQNLKAKVITKYGAKKAEPRLKNINDFMSGQDYYSQSNVSGQLNHLLHLLTA